MINKEKLFTQIQNVINANLVIVLGSGASISYNISSMWDLALELKTFFKDNPYSNEESQDCINKFIDNLNAGLGLEEALLKIKVTMEVELKIVELVWKKIIKQDKEIYEKVKQGEEINLVSLFNHIIYGRDSAILNIVSTNYDKIAEYAASQTDAFLNTGFSHNLRGVFFTDLNPKLYAKLKPYTGCINIWKVHGSLDWFYRNEDIFCFPNTYDIPLGCTPCIITPGTNKYEKTQNDPHRSLLSIVDNIFNEASGFLCIGYGFNDSHVHPKLINHSKKKRVPILIVTKKATDSIKESVMKQCSNYIIIEDDNHNGTNFWISNEPDALNIPNEIYWTIEGLCKII